MQVDETAEWQTANQINQRFAIRPHTLKNLALAGRVRTKSDPAIWPHRFYSVEDVQRFKEEEERSGLPRTPRGIAIAPTMPQAESV